MLRGRAAVKLFHTYLVFLSMKGRSRKEISEKEQTAVQMCRLFLSPKLRRFSIPNKYESRNEVNAIILSADLSFIISLLENKTRQSSLKSSKEHIK